MPNPPSIIDRGRGPEIAGTRITVYDIMDYYTHGHPTPEIATILRVTPEEVELAIRYIEDHMEEVSAAYQRILDRHAKGNPPEVQAKVDQAASRGREILEKWKQRKSTGGSGAPIAR